jgi:zinc protease
MAESRLLQAAEVDGVPTFWGDIGESHDTLCLLFRAGHSDERFTRVGLTHLVEHLALNTIGPQPYAWNGFVDLTMCAFHATGRPDELVAFAARVCRALAQLPTDRLERETRVLRTEAEGRSRGPFQRLLWYRFGAQGYGLSGLPEWALWTATMAEIQAWADARFTRRNAALWYMGRLPADLRLPLPEGQRYAAREPTPISPLPLPSATRDVPGAVALGALCHRDSAMTVAAGLCSQQALTRLRLDEGVARHVECSYAPLTAELAHLAFSIPVLPEHADAVRIGLVEVLQRMAAEGPAAADLELAKEQGRRAWTDRHGVYSMLDWQAREELIGGRVLSLEELLAELEAVSAETAHAAIAAALPSAILLVPEGGQRPGDPFLDYPASSVDRIRSGRPYCLAPKDKTPHSRLHRWFFPPPPPPAWPRLLIGDDGVTLSLAPDRQVTVHRGECAGYLCGQEGERTAFGLDGFNVRVARDDWIDGEQALRDLDAVFPEHCRIGA